MAKHIPFDPLDERLLLCDQNQRLTWRSAVGIKECQKRHPSESWRGRDIL